MRGMRNSWIWLLSLFTLASLFGTIFYSQITRISIFAVYPTAAILTILGIFALWYAARQEQ